jgi:hypothetical protein
MSTREPRTRRAIVFVALLAILGASVFILRSLNDEPATRSPKVEPGELPRFPTLAVVGDIACDPGNANFNDGEGQDGECMHGAVYSLIDPQNEDRVFSPDRLVVLGDVQYDAGEYDKYFADGAYDDTFGRLRELTWPVPGNHDYRDDGAEGYFDYFNGEGEDDGLAGERGKGYYSQQLGCDEDGNVCTWRFLFLNTELDGDEWETELAWLEDQIATYEEDCLAVVGHSAPFSTADHFEGESASGESMLPVWDALYGGTDEDLDPERNADLLLVAHSHAYLRYLPQNDDIDAVEVDGSDDEHPVAEATNEAGVTEILVGTGGESTDLKDEYLDPDPNEAYRDLDVYGLLKLGLGSDSDPASWDAEFYEIGSTSGDAPSDSASGDCH